MQGNEPCGGRRLTVEAFLRIEFNVREGIIGKHRFGKRWIFQQGADVEIVIKCGFRLGGIGLPVKDKAGQLPAGAEPLIPLGIPGSKRL